jgi:hypothetical protein
LTVSVWPAIVAVRTFLLAAVLAGMVTETEPDPVPAAGNTPRPLAVHAQDEEDAVMPTRALPAAAVALIVEGLMANEQAAVANWVTVNVWPPTVIVPVLELFTVFAAAVKPIVLLPVPEMGPVNVSHESPGETVALQEQEAPVETVKFPAPPAAITLVPVGLRT